MTLLAIASAFAGFVALAMAMDRHYRQFRLRRPPLGLRLSLRVIGASLLGLSLVLCAARLGWSVGPILCLGLLTASALALVLLLSYVPLLLEAARWIKERPAPEAAEHRAAGGPVTSPPANRRR